MTKQSINPPNLTWREDGQPVATSFGDTYFSVENGLEESRYVFLKHNGLPQRWQERLNSFHIVETGFGTGLNFLMTWQSFNHHASKDCWLEYTSIEKFPLSREQLIKALALWPDLTHLKDQLLTQYPEAVPGFHRLVWPHYRIGLTLVFGDVHDVLPQLSGPVHAWYLDGFAPSCNPDMWTDALFQQMRRLSRETAFTTQGENTTCATFTSAGLVRRGLKGAGFNVEKVTGYGRKREMLQAQYYLSCGPERPPHFDAKPWLSPPTKPAFWRPDTTWQQGEPKNGFKLTERKITVIGAGLAGCSTARSLAERGWLVTVLDSAGIANGGSGNPQGGLYVKLAANDQAVHSDFYLQAFQYATTAIERLLGPGDKKNNSWCQCGVLQLATSEEEAERQRRFLKVQALPTSLVQSVNAPQASHLAGIQLDSSGLYYPEAGWVNPRHLCHHMLQHPNISIRSTGVKELAYHDDSAQWELTLGDRTSHTTPRVVIATANEAATLLPNAWLPLRSIRGQLSYLDAAQTPSPTTVLCGSSYIAPAAAGQNWLVMGATYNLNDINTELTTQDHQTNLAHLQEFGRMMPEPDMALVKGGRVGFRCTTPDYLPMVGPVPICAPFVEAYKPMVRNARQIPPIAAPSYPGLWLNVGHGSRGLASTPLCAEILANQISETSSPVSTAVKEALWPGRFLLRDMIRRRLPKEWYD